MGAVERVMNHVYSFYLYITLRVCAHTLNVYDLNNRVGLVSVVHPRFSVTPEYFFHVLFLGPPVEISSEVEGIRELRREEGGSATGE
jgi:hypothetical protein